MASFHRLRKDAGLLRDKLTPDDQGLIDEVLEFVSAMADSETGPSSKVGIRDRITADLRRLLTENELTGRIAEIGGSRNGMATQFPDHEFAFLSLYPSEDPATVVADISNCPQIPDESFDAVVSVSCFEHIERPWRAAEEITRILRPGGVTYHVAPFSYFYHLAPVDFWRFTPEGLAFLFRDLEPLETEFYGANRRRNNVGTESNPIDGHGEPQFAVDAFGGWRENWHAIYAGRKTPGWAERRQDREVQQVVVDFAKVLVSEGTPEHTVGEKVSGLLSMVGLNRRGELIPAPPNQGLTMSAERCEEVWRQRGQLGLRPGFQRFSRVAVARGAAPVPDPADVQVLRDPDESTIAVEEGTS